MEVPGRTFGCKTLHVEDVVKMTNYRIDNLQYANWSEKIFRQMRDGGVDAVHVTIAYHENFRETVLNIERWNRWFEQHPDLIFHGEWASDVARARETGRTAPQP